MPVNMPFKYPPIVLDKTEIRLFRLVPGKSLAGVFAIHELKNNPQFTAISYTWGPPNPIRDISIEGQSTTVRDNLWQFLSSFRDHTDVWLWIDQICIDQSAVDERNHQVGLMATIYEKAAEVLVWLGSKADGSDEAIEAINSGASLTGRYESQVQTLFRRPYWNRLWILQEVLMGRNISVLCGTQRFSWKALEALFIPGESDGEGAWTYPVEICNVALSLIHEKASFKGAERRLSYMLATFADLRCEDVRDKVYGLLSLVRQSGVIPVDYSKSAPEVFFTAVQKIVEDENYISFNSHLDISQHLLDRMELVDISDSDIFSFVESELGKRRKVSLFEKNESGFKLEVDVDVDTNEDKCDFCRLFCDLWAKDSSGHEIRLERDRSNRSTLKRTDGAVVHVISVIGIPALALPMGLPQLPKPDIDVFFGLLQLWLRDCDTNHSGCKQTTQLGLPTRLINVGTKDEPQLRLLETRGEAGHEDQYRKYIALSHPWGDPAKHPPFKTIKVDLDGSKHDVETFKKAIPYGELPKAFQDAVDTTQRLGVRYLWIDAICIIQGNSGDWEFEAKRMEAVYNSAYCTITASQSTGQHDGFWKEELPRGVITFQRPNQQLSYVCEHIEDFGLDFPGPSNPRGWALQELSLTRRRINFSHSQTHFRCGKGTQCETLGNMRNDVAVASSEAIRRQMIMKFEGQYQNLYKSYSKLEFSNIADRPVAIRGLEKRLSTAYKVPGCFGIFYDGRDGGLFHTSLLWCRKQDDPMTLINFTERNIYIPTWSWMTYKGSIDYVLRRESIQIHWEEEDVCPPNTDLLNKSLETAALAGDLDILIRARKFVVTTEREGQYMIKYDSERTRSLDGSGPYCVIVAKHRGDLSVAEKLHYILIVTRNHRMGKGGKPIYERLGAGYMLGRYIETDKPYMEGWIH